MPMRTSLDFAFLSLAAAAGRRLFTIPYPRFAIHWSAAALLAFSGSAAAQERFDDPALVSVRVELGANDRRPQVWDGKLSVSGGELLGISSRRPTPGDSLAGNAWKLSSWQGPNYRYPAPKPQPVTGVPVNIFNPGLIVDLKTNGRARMAFETEQGGFRVDLRDLQLGRPRRFLGGRVVASRTVSARQISERGRQNDFASLATGPNGQVWVVWVAYRAGANEVLLRHYDGEKWGAIEKVTEKPGDVFLAKAARGGDGRIHVVWSDQADGNRDLYARVFDGERRSPVQRLSEAPQPDLYHNLATDSAGRVWVVWQGFRDGQADIFARFHDGERWSPAEKISTSQANDWEPAIAADSGGNVYAAWDTYDKGNYDILLRRHNGASWEDIVPLADTPKFEAHVTLACDADDRLWAAWSESGTLWGKDNGFGLEQEGTRLYQWRKIAVAALDGGRLREPAVPLDDALPPELQDKNDLPTVQPDGKGGVWVFFRHRNPRLKDIVSDFEAHRAAWELWGIRYAGGAWGTPLYFPHSTGRMDVRSAFAQTEDGGIAAAWPTDNRDFASMLVDQADIYVAKIPPPAAGGALKLQPRVQPEITVYPIHPNETRDLETIRNYEIVSGGKTYKIYRGDTHRHTEFSMDGFNDGSLLQAYRYAIDAASLDYYANSEHNFLGGPNVEYHDFLLQQFVDCFHLPGRFTPLFAYERSVRYPNGHRNIIFAKRGVRPFPISTEEFGSPLFPFATEEATKRSANPEPVGTKDLYAYLKENDGIAISHTSATNMGTDWRDNDPAVEPLVEIYQGDRVSAEYEGAPRAAYAGNPRSAPGGFRPAGYVWNAWAKGYKLGVQAASDHVSTHISYACTISEDAGREGLLDAMRKRHSYGATDNIVLDYRLRSGGKEYLQGDIVTVSGDFRLSVRVIGTEPIRQIDIIRNREFVHTRQNLGQEAAFTFADNEAQPGESYYYVRVRQVDGQIAWSSPIWVTVGSR